MISVSLWRIRPEISANEQETFWPWMQQSLWCLSLRRKGFQLQHWKYSHSCLVPDCHSETNTHHCVEFSFNCLLIVYVWFKCPTKQTCEGNLLAWDENPFFSRVFITTLWYAVVMEDDESRWNSIWYKMKIIILRLYYFCLASNKIHLSMLTHSYEVLGTGCPRYD